MEVVQVILMFCLMCVSAAHGKDIEEASYSDLLFEKLLTKFECLQEKMETMESAMKEADQKLQQVINQQNENVAALQAELKKDRELFDETLTTVTGAINLLKQTMDHNFTSVQEQWKSEINKRQDSNDQQLAVISQAIQQLYQETGTNFTTLRTQLNGLHNAQTTCVNHEEMRKGIQMLAYKQDVALLNIKPNLNLLDVSFSTCKKKPSKTTGKYYIQPSTSNVPFNGVCEQAAFGGGWLVFQYRFNGSVNFFRNWTEYRDGFGSLDGEFWLGLEHLRRLTSAKPHELLVELKDWNGTHKYAWYDRFEIADESEQYALKILGKYTGTAGDALIYHQGMKFTTADRDNDLWYNNCASSWTGGWWFKACHYSNLNGLYQSTDTGKFIKWSASPPIVAHSYTTMMIRES